MKKRHYILTAIVSYLVLLIATIPAKPITELVNDSSLVYLQGVSGTLWKGNTYIITANDTQLKKTEWSFNLWRLFLGEISINIKTHYLKNIINAELGTSFLGRFFVNDLTAEISAQELAQLANIPLVQLDGSIAINIKRAQWKQGELPQAIGEIKWNNATVTVAESAALGNVSIILGESEQQQLQATISNQGGDIKINGTAKLVPEKNYIANITLRPAASASNNIKQSLGLFAQKQTSGDFLLKKSGSLNEIM